MQRKTHNNIARFFFPNIKLKEADTVNGAIDNPSKRMVALQNSGMFSKTQMDAFGLTKNGGHRRYNHSIDSAIMAAFMVNSKHPLELALTHLAVDKFSNILGDTFGGNKKDMIEGMMNSYMVDQRRNNGEKPRKRRQMHFE